MTTQTSGISQSLPRVSYVKVSGQQQSQVYISNAYAYDPNSFTTANGGRFTQSARTTFRDKKTSCDIEPIYITHAVRDKASVANVSSVCGRLVDRVTLSQGHPVGSVCDRLIDRFQPVIRVCDRLIDKATLSSVCVTVLLTGSPCRQFMWPSYWQGYPVGSVCDRFIDRASLSSEYVTVLLTGPPCHQYMWPSYRQCMWPS